MKSRNDLKSKFWRDALLVIALLLMGSVGPIFTMSAVAELSQGSTEQSKTRSDEFVYLTEISALNSLMADYEDDEGWQKLRSAVPLNSNEFNELKKLYGMTMDFNQTGKEIDGLETLPDRFGESEKAKWSSADEKKRLSDIRTGKEEWEREKIQVETELKKFRAMLGVKKDKTFIEVLHSMWKERLGK